MLNLSYVKGTIAGCLLSGALTFGGIFLIPAVINASCDAGTCIPPPGYCVGYTGTDYSAITW
jgi:hypothetical protein